MPRLFVYFIFIFFGGEMNFTYTKKWGEQHFTYILFFLQGEHCHKYKVLITGVKVQI